MRKSLRLFLAAIAAVVFMLAGCASAPPEPVEISLPAANATLHTSGALVLEENEGILNVGWWETVDDIVSWEVEIPQDGEYVFSMRAACDPQFPGSIVVLTIDGQSLEVKVRDTGDWLYYVNMEFGSLNVSAGTHTLSLQASHVDNRFVANLRRVDIKSL